MSGDDGSLNVCEDCGIELAPDSNSISCAECSAVYDDCYDGDI